MRPFAVGFGSSDVWWVGLSAFVAAFAGWFAIKTRLGMSWLLRRARKGYLAWHEEAIERTVSPKFTDAKLERLEIAESVKDEALKTAAVVEDKLLGHIADEERLIRETVTGALEPLERTVSAHVVADEEAFAENAAAQAHQDETLARIEAKLAGT